MGSINLEEHSAREMVSRLSIHELKELLDHSAVEYESKNSTKEALEEIIVNESNDYCYTYLSYESLISLRTSQCG